VNAANRDYDEVLRRALRAAADSVEPSADGLERIRARLSGRPLMSFASASAWCSDAALRFATWAAPFIDSALNAFWSVIDRFKPGGVFSGRTGRRLGWLRPFAAMGTAIFVVAAGAFAIMTLPQDISSSGSTFTIFPWTQHSGPKGGSGKSGVAGSGSYFQGSASSPGSSGGSSLASPSPSPCTSPKAPATGSATPTPTMSASTAPSAPSSSSPPASIPPTVNPTTPTVTPTVSDSATPNPGSATTPNPSASPASTGNTAAGLAAAAQPGTAFLYRAHVQDPHVALMVPSRSSAAAATPCPSPSAKKKSSPPLAAGLSALGIAPDGVTERGDARHES